LILVLVVVFGGLWLFRWRQKANLQKKIDAIRAAGYPVTCVELDDWYSIPDDVENAADLIQEAIADYRKPQNSEFIPIVGQAERPGRTEELSAELMKLIGEHLAENEQTLTLLSKAAGIEHSRYPVDFRTGFITGIDHLRGVRTAARLAKLEALSLADKNEGDAAVESVKRIYSVGRSLSAEPAFVSQLVRIACDALGVSAIECVVNRADLADEQLAELSTMVAGAERRSDLIAAFVGERCMVLDRFRNPENMDPQMFGGSRLGGILLGVYKGAGLTKRGAIIYLDFAEDLMAVNRLSEHRRIEAAKAIEAKLEQKSGISAMMVQMLVPAYARVIEIHLVRIGGLRTAVVALAIERYRLAEAKLPSTLEKLVPKYLGAVPRDPIDGEELRYKRLEKGYVVYSIGQDRSDDGGREKSKRKNGNWDVTFIVER